MINGLRVGIIKAQITAACADASTYTGHYRLVTCCSSTAAAPAASLIRLHHERWGAT